MSSNVLSDKGPSQKAPRKSCGCKKLFWKMILTFLSPTFLCSTSKRNMHVQYSFTLKTFWQYNLGCLNIIDNVKLNSILLSCTCTMKYHKEDCEKSSIFLVHKKHENLDWGKLYHYQNAQKHFWFTTRAPESAYSSTVTNMVSNVESDAKMEPPIQGDRSRLSGARSLRIFGLSPLNSFSNRGTNPDSLVEPPERTMLRWHMSCTSESHLVTKTKE